MKKALVVIFVMLVAVKVLAQNKTDSLEKILPNSFGERRLSILIQLAEKNINIAPDKALAYSLEAEELAEQLEDSSLWIESLNLAASSNLNLGNFNEAVRGYEQALAIAVALHDSVKQADLFNSIGIAHDNLGNYEEALSSYFQSLRLSESLFERYNRPEFELKIADAYNNIGLIYYSMRRYKDAIANFNTALDTYERKTHKYGINLAANNLGLAYHDLKEYDKALEYFDRSLSLEKEMGNLNGVAASYNNIGNIYRDRNNHEEALSYYQNALTAYEALGNFPGISTTLINLGTAYYNLNQFHRALTFQRKGLKIAQEINARYTILEGYKGLSETYEKLNNSIQALHYMKQYAALRDSVFNEESSARMAEMQAKYETTHKQKQIELLNKNKELQQAELERQLILRNSLFGGSVLVLLLAFLLYYRYREAQRIKAILAMQNVEIMQQKEEIETQRDQIEEKNQHLQEAFNLIEAKNLSITGSINYARRIQDAILPSVEKIQNVWPDAFIYYKPKDIVSGDFYWFVKQNDIAIIAVIDCTGHGVPGAFMSMMGHTLLNQIVNEKGITQPAEILQNINCAIFKSLSSKNGHTSNRDGMEAVICTYHMKDKVLEYAGARSPLYLFSAAGMIELKGDRAILGTQADAVYTNHQVRLNHDTMIYLSSDGYQDQFGGEKGKKFLSVRLKNLLTEIYTLPAVEQEKVLEDTFRGWCGNEGQVDDILIAGIRLEV